MFNNLMKTPVKANLLKHLGNEEYPSEITLKNVKEFIRIVLYNGKVAESYTDTRITKYKSLAIKTSAAIPPDQDSIVQVILRAHLQVFKWKRCTQLEIKSLPYERFGWNWSNDMQMVVPVWFVGHQLPEDLRSRKGKPAASVNSVDDKVTMIMNVTMIIQVRKSGREKLTVRKFHVNNKLKQTNCQSMQARVLKI